MKRYPISERKGMEGLSGMPAGGAAKKPVILGLLLLAFAAAALVGCAGPRKPVAPQPAKESDAFFEKWKVKAETSQGHSPAARAREVEQPSPKKTRAKEEATPAKAPQKPLPVQKVSLRMHNADVVVVLRALARAVGQNILINDKVKGTVSVDIESVPWDQAFRGILRLQGLEYAWEGDLLRIMTVQDLENDLKMDSVREKQKAQKQEVKLVEPLIIRVVPIDYGDASKLQEKLKEYLSKDEKGNPIGAISVDEHTNSLVLHALQDDVARLIPLISELDKPTPQILIVSNIVEATKDVAHRLGVQWGGFYKADSTFVTPGGTGGRLVTDASGHQQVVYDPLSTVTGIGGQGFGSNFPVDVADAGGTLGFMIGKVGGNILDMQLMALQSEGKINILSSPSITTLDNQTAFTENGQKVPYQSTSQQFGTEVKFEDAVLRLEITPHVIQDDYLKMKILVKKDEVDTVNNVGGNPFINKKQTQTTLIARDGETIVISGLTKQTTNDTAKGMPGLKDTPLFGWLFRSKDQASNMQDVLIFITPHILKAPRVARAVDGEEGEAPAPMVRPPRRGQGAPE